MVDVAEICHALVIMILHLVPLSDSVAECGGNGSGSYDSGIVSISSTWNISSHGSSNVNSSIVVVVLVCQQHVARLLCCSHHGFVSSPGWSDDDSDGDGNEAVTSGSLPVFMDCSAQSVHLLKASFFGNQEMPGAGNYADSYHHSVV